MISEANNITYFKNKRSFNDIKSKVLYANPESMCIHLINLIYILSLDSEKDIFQVTPPILDTNLQLFLKSSSSLSATVHPTKLRLLDE